MQSRRHHRPDRSKGSRRFRDANIPNSVHVIVLLTGIGQERTIVHDAADTTAVDIVIRVGSTDVAHIPECIDILVGLIVGARVRTVRVVRAIVELVRPPVRIGVERRQRGRVPGISWIKEE